MTAGDPIAAFPDALVDALRARRGRSLAAERLFGMSGANVWRVHGASGSVIVKRAVNPREHRFYTAVAPDLRARGVAIPELVAAHAEHADSDAWWVALEDLPRTLPRERWLADPEVLANLARLHATPWSALAGAGSPAAWYRLGWTDEMERVIGSSKSRDDAARWLKLLTRGHELLGADAVTSNDPNLRNWGLRDDGSVALFDWERFGAGHPAFDLAITVPGMGAPSDYARVADAYRAVAAPGARVPTTVDIALGKAWNVAEFLALEYTQPAIDRATLRALQAALPAWLEETSAFVR